MEHRQLAVVVSAPPSGRASRPAQKPRCVERRHNAHTAVTSKRQPSTNETDRASQPRTRSLHSPASPGQPTHRQLANNSGPSGINGGDFPADPPSRRPKVIAGRSRKDHRIRRTVSDSSGRRAPTWTIRTRDPYRTGIRGRRWMHWTDSNQLKPPFHSRGVRVRIPLRALTRRCCAIEIRSSWRAHRLDDHGSCTEGCPLGVALTWSRRHASSCVDMRRHAA